MARTIIWMVAIGAALQCVQANRLPGNSVKSDVLVLSLSSNTSSYQTLTEAFFLWNMQAICTNEQCVLTAADILRDMNPKADPCQDFSEFACMSILF